MTSGNAAFDTLKAALVKDSDLRSELEYALAANVSKVNPSDRANRFGSGAAVEWILAAACYRAGVLSIPAGHNANGFDLQDMRQVAQGLWSVKNSTTRSRSEFRLTNGMGGEGKGFVEPVVMLSPHLPGLVFADPIQHPDLASEAKKTGDAVVLPFKAVLKHAEDHPECVAPLKMPINEHQGTLDPWMDYVQTLLDPIRFPILSKMFLDAKPAVRSLADEIRALSGLREDGVLSKEQFDSAIERLTQG